MSDQGKEPSFISMFGCHVTSLFPAWFLFLVLFGLLCFLPGKVTNLIKADASSGFGAGQLLPLRYRAFVKRAHLELQDYEAMLNNLIFLPRRQGGLKYKRRALARWLERSPRKMK